MVISNETRKRNEARKDTNGLGLQKEISRLSVIYPFLSPSQIKNKAMESLSKQNKPKLLKPKIYNKPRTKLQFVPTDGATLKPITQTPKVSNDQKITTRKLTKNLRVRFTNQSSSSQEKDPDYIPTTSEVAHKKCTSLLNNTDRVSCEVKSQALPSRKRSAEERESRFMGLGGNCFSDEETTSLNGMPLLPEHHNNWTKERKNNSKNAGITCQNLIICDKQLSDSSTVPVRTYDMNQGCNISTNTNLVSDRCFEYLQTRTRQQNSLIVKTNQEPEIIVISSDSENDDCRTPSAKQNTEYSLVQFTSRIKVEKAKSSNDEVPSLTNQSALAKNNRRSILQPSPLINQNHFLVNLTKEVDANQALTPQSNNVKYTKHAKEIAIQTSPPNINKNDMGTNPETCINVALDNFMNTSPMSPASVRKKNMGTRYEPYNKVSKEDVMNNSPITANVLGASRCANLPKCITFDDHKIVPNKNHDKENEIIENARQLNSWKEFKKSCNATQPLAQPLRKQSATPLPNAFCVQSPTSCFKNNSLYSLHTVRRKTKKNEIVHAQTKTLLNHKLDTSPEQNEFRPELLSRRLFLNANEDCDIIDNAAFIRKIQMATSQFNRPSNQSSSNASDENYNSSSHSQDQVELQLLKSDRKRFSLQKDCKSKSTTEIFDINNKSKIWYGNKNNSEYSFLSASSGNMSDGSVESPNIFRERTIGPSLKCTKAIKTRSTKSPQSKSAKRQLNIYAASENEKDQQTTLCRPTKNACISSFNTLQDQLQSAYANLMDAVADMVNQVDEREWRKHYPKEKDRKLEKNTNYSVGLHQSNMPKTNEVNERQRYQQKLKVKRNFERNTTNYMTSIHQYDMPTVNQTEEREWMQQPTTKNKQHLDRNTINYMEPLNKCDILKPLNQGRTNTSTTSSLLCDLFYSPKKMAKNGTHDRFVSNSSSSVQSMNCAVTDLLDAM